MNDDSLRQKIIDTMTDNGLRAAYHTSRFIRKRTISIPQEGHLADIIADAIHQQTKDKRLAEALPRAARKVIRTYAKIQNEAERRAKIGEDVRRFASDMNPVFIESICFLAGLRYRPLFDMVRVKETEPGAIERMNLVAGQHPLFTTGGHWSNLDTLLDGYLTNEHMPQAQSQFCADFKIAKGEDSADYLTELGAWWIDRETKEQKKELGTQQLILTHSMLNLVPSWVYLAGGRSYSGRFNNMPKVGLLQALIALAKTEKGKDIHIGKRSLSYPYVPEDIQLMDAHKRGTKTEGTSLTGGEYSRLADEYRNVKGTDLEICWTIHPPRRLRDYISGAEGKHVEEKVGKTILEEVRAARTIPALSIITTALWTLHCTQRTFNVGELSRLTETHLDALKRHGTNISFPDRPIRETVERNLMTYFQRRGLIEHLPNPKKNALSEKGVNAVEFGAHNFIDLYPPEVRMRLDTYALRKTGS